MRTGTVAGSAALWAWRVRSGEEPLWVPGDVDIWLCGERWGGIRQCNCGRSKLLPRLLRVIPSTLSHAPLRRLAEAVRGRDTISEIWSSKKLRAHTPTRADTRVSSACR